MLMPVVAEFFESAQQIFWQTFGYRIVSSKQCQHSVLLEEHNMKYRLNMYKKKNTNFIWIKVELYFIIRNFIISIKTADSVHNTKKQFFKRIRNG